MLAMWLNPMMRCQFLFYLTYQPPLAKVIIPFSLKYTMLFSSLIAPLVRIRLPCERPGFNPWVGKIPWRRERLPTPVLGFPCVSAGKESAFNAGDPGSIPGLGRSPGEGKGYLFQYSGLGNSMDSVVHGVTKSRTHLSDCRCHFTSLPNIAFS